jgi:hypothetical protein
MNQSNTARRILTGLLLAFLLAAPVMAAKPLDLQELFSPFEYLDITQTYERYSGIIDLLVYILIFVGLGQAILAHRYPGPGGRAVAIGVGLALALAMVLAEEWFQFNIRSFGPFAATLIVVLLGIMMFSLLNGAGMSKLASASLAYVTIFFGMRAVSPEFFDRLNETMPLLSVAGLVALVAAVVTVVTGLFPGSGHSWFRLARHGNDTPRQHTHRKDIYAEAGSLKKYGEPIAKKSIRESGILVRDLKAAREAIKKHGQNPAHRRNIVEQMQQFIPRENELLHDIENLKTLSERLLAFDEQVLHEDLHAQWAGATPEGKERLKREIHAELAKANLEKRMAHIAFAMRAHLEALHHSVTESAHALNDGQVREALALMDRAIMEDAAIGKMAQQVRAMEKLLLRFVRHELFS